MPIYKLMQNGIRVRRATETNAAALAQLSEELGYTVSPELMQERIRAVLTSAADLLIIGQDSSGAAVAWLQAHAAHVLESGFRVEILGLIVANKMRRRGVGRLLVNEAENWARSLLADAVVVRTNIERFESHPFYAALGYTTTKTQTVYRKTLKN